MSLRSFLSGKLRVLSRCIVALTLLGVGLAMTSPHADAAAPAQNPENTVYLDVPDGRVVIKLRPDLAPNHVARIKELVHQGFYNGLKFHRVIPGFMAQTGDPLGNGMGGSGQKLAAEFNSGKHVRGTVSMARANDPNSADSQFFICYAAVPQLDGQYTVWGEVVSGMEYIDKVKAGSMSNNGAVDNPTKIVKMALASDEK